LDDEGHKFSFINIREIEKVATESLKFWNRGNGVAHFGMGGMGVEWGRHGGRLKIKDVWQIPNPFLGLK
jgi:hypothetical protein